MIFAKAVGPLRAEVSKLLGDESLAMSSMNPY
jgi:hypothetical protein